MFSFINQSDEHNQAVWSVGELTTYIRRLFELDYRLQDIEVSGEISNFTRASSGHLYFVLKDNAAQIKCVMWRSQAALLRYRPAEGDAVLVRGRISVYEAGGVYQLYAEQLQPMGRGDLAAAFEQLKEALAAEGLFDAENKQPIPYFPRKIGIVTSSGAAALRDILNVLQRRNPLVSVLIAPTLVQGELAPQQIVRALRWLDDRDDIDTIIIARGGGSIEDLWAFNDERVARAIFAARHPIISGIGHETDFTITDFVADLRAPTPSAAAELSVPDLSNAPSIVQNLAGRLLDGMEYDLAQRGEAVRTRSRLLSLLSPRRVIDADLQRVDGLIDRIDRAVKKNLDRQIGGLSVLQAKLSAVNPIATLARGYAIARDVDGRLIRSIVDARSGEKITIQVSDGTFGARVSE